MNSLTRAAHEREKQGFCEVEVSYGGEEELYQHSTACDKNPGHEKFVPVNMFTVNSLPEGYQDNDLEEFIHAMADLTVRVSVAYVSDRRPATYPDTDKSYPCYKGRDKNLTRTGSGWVYQVNRFSPKVVKTKKGSFWGKTKQYQTKGFSLWGKHKKYQVNKSSRSDKKKKKLCTCTECSSSPAPEQEFAYIIIKTANHVVFDDLEGACTTCLLFFDNGDSPDQYQGVVTLKGMSHVVSDIDSDTCQMTYVTHEMDLVKKLEDMCARRSSLNEKLKKKYNNNLSIQDKISIPIEFQSEHTLTVIVSHPHGCSKRISLGHYTRRLMVKSVWSSYEYDTPTCPGTSGALVFVLGSCLLVFDHAHSGNCKGNKRLNFSGHGID